MFKFVKANVITLIPKLANASQIIDYRMISLCNMFYKIVANRMKGVLPFIIHPSQSSFIKKRISLDNIILASDLLRDFNSLGKDKCFFSKLDIYKAFDIVSRYFLYSF